MLRRSIVSLLLVAQHLCAEPLKVTRAIGSVIRGPGKIQTGGSSRIELELPPASIIRVGSNAALRFGPGPGDLALDSGTLMLSSPKGSKELVVRTSSVIASMKGGTLQMSNVGGQVKVIGLDGKVVASIAAKPKEKAVLKPGQLVTIPAGATKMPTPATFVIKAMLSSSILLNMGPFPGRAAIEKNAGAQEPKRSFRVDLFSPDVDPAIGLASTAMQVNAILAQETARQEAAATVAAQQQAAVAQQQQQIAQQAAQARQQAETAARLASARQQAAQSNQGNAFGPQGNQGQGPQGNQGQGPQGNQGQGPQGNQGQPPATPPGQGNQGQGSQGNQGQGGGQGRQ